MSFSASTCLTNSGTVALGGTFNIYSNYDEYTSPFQTNVSYTSLFGPLCPYVMGNVPNGTTSIRIVDITTNCCATIDLLSNNLCTTCELSFDSYQTNNISRIVAGELTGSCENDITDYRIFWYGPNSSTNLAFTSGYGSTFTPYSLTHPLVGINSPMVEAGIYIPVVDKVKLNGLNYSQTGGTGYIQAELECFNATTVNVSPFTCDNGTVVSGNYTHQVNFAGAAVGVTPLSLQSTFDLDLTTNYFAWKFKGEDIPDTLTITFHGSGYSDPIILEKFYVGQNTQTNFNPLILPKSASTSGYLVKVTTLTSLNRNPGDYLMLNVTPNPNNTQTNWDFYFTCLETFDCDLCLYDYLNTPYKIQSSSITGITGTCSSIDVSFNLSGCTTSSLSNSDIYKYLCREAAGLGSSLNLSTLSGTVGLIPQTYYDLYWSKTSCSQGGGSSITPCQTSTNTISFSKSNTGPSGQGVINMTFSSLSDLTAYKASYDAVLPLSGTPTNNTSVDYYRYYILKIPNRSGLEICGDGTSFYTYNIHFSSTFITGGTPGNYSLTITMPTIIENLPPYGPCDISCQTTLNQFVTNINSSSTGTTNVRSITTNTGARYQSPIPGVSYFISPPPSTNIDEQISGSLDIDNYLNLTQPFSGSSSPFTRLISLSAQTCNFSTMGVTIGPGYQRQVICFYNYKVELTDSNNVKSFRILADSIVNGVPTNVFNNVVATVVNGSLTYANPSYTF